MVLRSIGLFLPFLPLQSINQSIINTPPSAGTSIGSAPLVCRFLFLFLFAFLARAHGGDGGSSGGGGSGGGRGAVPPRGPGCAFQVYPDLGNHLLAPVPVPGLGLGL